MSDRSAIEWTDATWNPMRARSRGIAGDPHDKTYGRIGWHCEHASEGCRFCYAEALNKRLGTGLPFKPGHRGALEIFLDENALLAPLKWKKPRRIFVCSMTDLFADFVKDEWIDRVFAVMALCPQHRFQVLTKRAKRMREYCSTIQKHGRWLAMEDIAIELGYEPRGKDDHGFDWISHKEFLPNVLLGVSAEDQANADARIPGLLATPAAVRFVSLEPLLGAINLEKYLPHSAEPPTWPKLHWVICGGESGPQARPMHPDWARSIRDQCAAAGVPFFFKQWGAHAPYGRGHIDSRSLTTPGSLDMPMQRFGKKIAGRLLDGIEHNGMPAA